MKINKNEVLKERIKTEKIVNDESIKP